MQGTNRIVFNTAVLYTKIIICMVISLWTVPLVLSSLGKADFGLYNLVAGVIAMLAFLNGAMTVSTQRFLSVTIGEGDGKKLLEVYNLSILLHIIIGVIVVLLVESCAPLLFDNFLSIDPARLATARRLLNYLVVSVFFSIFMVPFDAVLNAYENLLVFSIVGVIEGLLKLSVALCLAHITGDRLNFYGIAIASVMVSVFLMKSLYVVFRYRHLRFSAAALRNMRLFREMFFFAGWNTISTLSIVFRNQGLAVVLNHFFGTVVNAAYGIGNQINGVLGYFSSTIQKSVNPQLMQSQGAHDSDKLFSMTYGLSKYSTLCMGIVAIPVVVEMPYILRVWLTNPPEGTVAISRLIIVLSLTYQLSSGLMSAIQSTGRIKWYTTTIGLLLLSTLPVAYAFLKYGCPTESALITACVIEVVALGVRLFFARRLVGLSVKTHITKVIIPVVLLFVGVGLILEIITLLVPPSFIRLLAVCITSVAVYCFFAYRLLLSKSEQAYVAQLVHKTIRR
ncbi:MAG: hypothetical protein LUC49_01890 [Prevotella sp.]|nr:hypothetical protein [Prevotella sp.]